MHSHPHTTTRPPELPIWPHSEYGWSTIHPAWLTFSALAVAPRGGATPLISSLAVAAAVARRAPAFAARLRRLGVRYLYRYGAEDAVSTTGASVRSAYGRDVRPGEEGDPAAVRRRVEAQVRRHSERFEWHEDGSLSVTHVVPSECPLSLSPPSPDSGAAPCALGAKHSSSPIIVLLCDERNVLGSLIRQQS